MARFGTALAPWRGSRGLGSTDPIRDIFDMQRRMARLMDETYGANEEVPALASWTPAVDIYEDKDAYLIKAELPEIEKEDVKVSLDNNVLTISGARKFEHEDKRDNYHRVERAYGQFTRSFTLPNNVETEKIGAEFKTGVLRLTIPKKEEAKPKQIEVSIK